LIEIGESACNDHKEASPEMQRPMNSIKSKQCVTDHGEVFTPAWMVATR
jgi:hypothetical protein